MNEPSRLVPEGISHAPNLSALPPQERMEHHQRELRRIFYQQGHDGVRRYKAAHPDASSIIIRADARVFQPKRQPPADELAAMIKAWLDCDEAMGRTNRADVASLNARLGTDLDPDRAFNKPLSKALAKRTADLFAANGIKFDRLAHSTLGRVRQAVKDWKASRGQRTLIAGDETSVRIGEHTFPIERHSGHDCIRLTVAGKRLRLRFDAVKELVCLSGLGWPGEPPDYLLHSNRGDMAPNGPTTPSALDLGPCPTGTDDPLAATQDKSPVDPAPFPMPDLLGNRLRSIRQSLDYPSAVADDTDPLALYFSQGQE